MKSELQPCDRELLRQSLADSLSERQEDELARHLSACESCQRELERLAAAQAEWSHVGEILKREAQSSRLDARGERPAGSRIPWHHSGDSQLAPLDGHVVSVADFAVDFLEPATASETLGRLGDIDIHEVIGHGGMGIVLRGFQRELNRPVAVKVLSPHLATSGAARQRFAREAQATAVIVHPNVMPILTVHSSGKLPYLVMPYVACESLQQRLDREGPLAALDVLRIATQVAGGLAAAHAQGLVHRDVKPANILLEKGVDRAMLTDFGLARAVDDASLTRTGVIAGTPRYMSPEQARGDSVDARSDLFSLGSAMYAMCTGRPPFRAESSYGILRRITDTEPRWIREINPDIPQWLAGIIGKLHAKDPAGRFPSAAELARLLEGCLAHVQQPTAAPLPDPVQSLAGQAFPPARGHRPVFPGRLRPLAGAVPDTIKQQLGKLGPRFRRNVVIAAGAVLLATLIAVPIVTRRVLPPHPADKGTERTGVERNDTASQSGEPSSDHLSAYAAWRDDIDKQILELDQDTSVLEQRACRLWENDFVQQD